MKNFAFLITTFLLVSGAAQAQTIVLQKQATQVSGFDKIMSTTASDCSYAVVLRDQSPDMTSVFVNSDSAEYVNSRVDIPRKDLPLADGYQSTGKFGEQLSYRSGVLTVKMSAEPGLGSAVRTEMSITVSPDLTQVRSASAKKLDNNGFLGSERLMASIDCSF